MTIYANPTVIPMPEGDYPATWALRAGWWLIAIPGGIPCPGKAEDMHNTGMDGTWEADVVKDDRTSTIDVAARQVATSIMLERERIGGFSLPFPMTVGQVERLASWERDKAGQA